jgi:CHAT domain
MIVLDKLVALRCRDPQLLEHLCALAHSAQYAATLAEVERCAGEGRAPDPTQHEAAALHQQVDAWGLLDLFHDEPVLSRIKPDELLTLATFCDVRPDAKTMFHSDDTVFMRLVDLTKQGKVVVSKLMQDDFSRLAVLAHYFPPLWDDLREFAKGSDWTEHMLAVELFLANGKTVSGDPSAAAFAQIAETAGTPDGFALAAFMLTPPRFSGMLAEEVLAYDQIRAQLPHPDELLKKEFTPSAVEKGRALAKRALEKLSPPVRDDIESRYMLRLDALRELTRRRLFVKRDILERDWPALYDLMRRDFAGMLQFEKQIQRPDTCTEEELARLRPYLQDERLVRVLNLQPYFGHVAGAPATPGPITAPPLAAATAPPLQPGAPAPVPVTPASLQPGAAQQVTPPAVIELAPVNYEDVYLVVVREPGGDGSPYQVRLKTESATAKNTVRHAGVRLDWAAIRDEVRRLQFSREMVEGRMLSANPDFTSQLKKLGLMVYESLFPPGPMRDELLNMLASPRNLRLNWLGDQAEAISAVLPWESLYVPSAPVSFLALTRKYSLTRRNGEAKSMPVSPIGQTLRMLFVWASPDGVAPLPGIEQELASLRSVLESSGRAELRIVENANVAQVNDVVRAFRPHVFHFSGHGYFRPGASQGELIFQTSSGDVHLVSAEQLAVMLYENNVSLAVLNGCDTGVSSTNDAVSSVAGALVKAGVPAVVATMRDVMDEAASRFTREFYRSFVSGFTVEGCMGEARKALSLDNWDWSAYALFVGTADLNRLRVAGPARSPS